MNTRIDVEEPIVTESVVAQCLGTLALPEKTIDETVIPPLLSLVNRGWTGTDLVEAPVSVVVHTADPITKAGILSQLRLSSELDVVEDDDPQAQVALVVADTVDDVTVRQIHALSREHRQAIVVVVGQLDPRAILPVLDFGVRAVVTRAEATAERLAHVVRATASGHVEFPPDLLHHLIEQVGRVNRDVLEPRGLRFAGLTPREHDVLELIADGLSTREVALKLAYSERTIKNVLQDLTTRLQLRNRTQAVAYAVRNGWI
jgi:DNA-binding NarL/FixJ family response regulator